MLISNVEGAPREGSVLNKKLFLPARWSYMVRVKHPLNLHEENFNRR